MINPPTVSTDLVKVRPRERDAIVQALLTGVSPRIGLHLIQVGRKLELEAMISDIDRIKGGGGTFRIVCGHYGAGKTFFTYLIRQIALEKTLVTAVADLSPQKRLHATGGQARALYRELMVSLATRAKPEGGAMINIVERFVSNAHELATETGRETEVVIQEKLSALKEMAGGYQFSSVIAAYWRAHNTGNDALKDAVTQWLRAEYPNVTEARRVLGFNVAGVIGDQNFHESLKLFAMFCRLAGFGGLLVCMDEMVNLYKLNNATARANNYEQVLGILNDAIQGGVGGLGFLLGGTPEFVTDQRRGLYSYEALRSRLAQNSLLKGDLIDFKGPVITLATLTAEDLIVLLRNIRHVYALGDSAKYLVPDSAIEAFLHHSAKKLGHEFFRTPRTTITAFVGFLSLLEQNPTKTWADLIGAVEVKKDTGAAADELGAGVVDDQLADFTL